MKRIALAMVLAMAASACPRARPVVARPTAPPPAPVASEEPKKVDGPLPGWDHLTDATIIELRDTAAAPSHDVVFRLERRPDGYDWTAKATVYPATLAEPAPERSLLPYMGCGCKVNEICGCERYDHPLPEPRLSRGHVALAPVMALLTALEKFRATTADVDARLPWSVHYGHATISVPSAGPIHVTTCDGAWAVNRQPLDHTESLDAAWAALLAKLDAPFPAPPSLPRDFGSLAKATIVDIKQGWGGLGATYDVFIHMERSGTQFKFSAKISGSPNSLGERVPEPWTSGGCLCEADASCPCERAQPPEVDHEKDVVEASAVEAFLAAVARHRLAPLGENIRFAPWTDDGPYAHVVVWTSPTATPIHLSFIDQRRRWRVNGVNLTLDDGDGPPSPMTLRQQSIWTPYGKLLEAIGVDTWIPSGR